MSHFTASEMLFVASMKSLTGAHHLRVEADFRECVPVVYLPVSHGLQTSSSQLGAVLHHPPKGHLAIFEDIFHDYTWDVGGIVM